MSDERRHELEVEVDGTPELAWRMVTDPQQILRWFSAEATVEPKVGGVYRLAWTPEMVAEQTISQWDPPRRLVLVDSSDEQWKEMKVEWLVEIRGEKTVVRLIHSGIPADAKWDDFFDSTAQGWRNALAILRACTRYADQPVERFALMGAATTDIAELWKTVTGPDLLDAGESLASWRPGDRFELKTAFGDLWSGEVLLNIVPGTGGKPVGSLGLATDDGVVFMLGAEPHGDALFVGGGVMVFGSTGEPALANAKQLTDRLVKLAGVKA